MTWVKLCGMTRRRDVEAAAEAGADAVGFVIAAESPRRVSPAEARALGEGVPLERFLVSVDLAPGDLLAAAAEAGVDGVQPHGRYAAPSAAAALDAGYRVLFPVPVAGPIDLEEIPPEAIPLLDTAVPGRHGGTGRRFDWSLAAGLGRRVVMAGGLTPGNVGRAVEAARPWGVDVSGGIESAPGVKDVDEMRRFVETAR